MVGSRSACRIHGARAPRDRCQVAPWPASRGAGGEGGEHGGGERAQRAGFPPSQQPSPRTGAQGRASSLQGPSQPRPVSAVRQVTRWLRGACLIQHTPPQPLPGWCLARALRVKGHLPALNLELRQEALGGGSRGTHISVLRSRGQKTVTVTVTAPPQTHIFRRGWGCSPSPHPPLLPCPCPLPSDPCPLTPCSHPCPLLSLPSLVPCTPATCPLPSAPAPPPLPSRLPALPRPPHLVLHKQLQAQPLQACTGTQRAYAVLPPMFSRPWRDRLQAEGQWVYLLGGQSGRSWLVFTAGALWPGRVSPPVLDTEPLGSPLEPQV